MKVFTEGTGSYSEKVNFVDDNNVLVGYDLAQSCCEQADWFFSKEKYVKFDYDTDFEKMKEVAELELYSFDAEFFQEDDIWDGNGGAEACFKLKAEGKEDVYLHIFNAHNGYYGHGFEATINGVNWQAGCL